MDDPSKYIIVRSKDSEVIARYAADSSGKSVLAQVIKKTGSDGYLMQVDGLDVVGDEDEILQAGSYVFTPSAAGLLPTAGNIHEQVQKINQNLLALERKINDSKKSTHSATKIGKAVMLFESWQIERTAEIRGMLHDRCA